MNYKCDETKKEKSFFSNVFHLFNFCCLEISATRVTKSAQNVTAPLSAREIN